MTSACRGVPKEASPRTRDLERAVSLANAALEERPGSGEMVAVGARQVIDDGRYVWIVTFKLARLLPADPSQDIAGLGGELRARVDLESGGVVIGGGD
jgi:hypothetical protein